MDFNNWKKWFFSLPLWMKWFVLLMLLRPVIDQFWYIKDVSSFFSPSQVIGVVFPALVLMSVVGKKIPKVHIPLSLVFFTVLIFLNHAVLINNNPSVMRAGELIRHSTFIFIFFYMLVFIRNENDFYFLLQTFLISSLIPMGIMVYEISVGPIQTQMLSDSRGGGIRFTGGYADVVSYAIYFIGSFTIVNYFYIKSYLESKRYISTKVYVLFSGFTIVTLFLIKHTASWAVFLAVIILALRKYLTTTKGFLFVVLPLVFLGAFGGEYVYNQQIEPLINKEINVIEGESELDTSFNGRMSRWMYYFDIWDEMPVSRHLWGVSFSGKKVAETMVSGNMHNDYVRLLFLTGIVGLFLYVLFLLKVFLKVRYLPTSDQFIVLSALSIVALYSVSALPTIYHVLQYLFMAIVVHALKKSYSLSNASRAQV